jgi:hypothetical protein
MNEQQRIKAVLDRVLTWPSERQQDAAEVLSMMEQQHANAYRLSDEQLAEVRRRRSDPNKKLLTLAEFNERVRRLTGE